MTNKTAAILAQDKRHVWHPFTQSQTAPTPLVIERGKDCWLYDTDDKPYLDLISSWWVNLFGHCQPEIAAAIAQQATKLEQVVFADVTHQPAAQLAETLCEMLGDGFDRVFYSDDGSTAIEVAMKIAVQYFHNKGEKRPKFLAFDGAYHGDTAGAMSAAASFDFFDAYKSLLFPVTKIPYPENWENCADTDKKEAESLQKLEEALAQEDVAALLIEPLVQGAGGMRMVRYEWLEQVVKTCRRYNTLVIFDEVMTGFGRTNVGDNKYFAFQNVSVKPDIICLSKGITGGFLPMSVTVCSNTLYQQFMGESFAKALAHGHSYTANSLACAAALQSMQILKRPETQNQIKAINAVHAEMLMNLPAFCIKKRQQGTIAAFNIDTNQNGYSSDLVPKLKQAFWQDGLLLRPLGSTIYFLPPYCIEPSLLKDAWARALMIIEQAI